GSSRTLISDPRQYFSSSEFYCHPRHLHSFPTRRSSDLWPRSCARSRCCPSRAVPSSAGSRRSSSSPSSSRSAGASPSTPRMEPRDRKSTRLNSSHSQISYAAFRLKKKKLNMSIKETIGASLCLRLPYLCCLCPFHY